MADDNSYMFPGQGLNYNPLQSGVLANSTSFPKPAPTTFNANPQGGITSLGGVGYQAYMVPGGVNTPAPVAQPGQGALAGSTGGSVVDPKKKKGFIDRMNEASSLQWNKSTGGSGSTDNRSFMERMNSASSDQWDKFTGSGEYDKNDKANLDKDGNLKKPGMGFEDKLNAGFGLASVIANGFSR